MFAGRDAAADTLLDKALALDHGAPRVHWLKGQLAAWRGDRAAALAHYQACRARADVAAPADFMIAAMGGAETPERAPDDYVRAYFDWYAEGYDRHLTEALGFAVPALLHAAIAASDPAAGGAGLDLGCGTGLTGAAIAPLVGDLTGVDLSPAMLERARARGCYDRVVEAEVHAFLAGAPEASADLVVAGDVLVYVGDLAPLLRDVARALRPGGLFAATTEHGEDGVELAASGRYRHGVAAVERQAAAAGLAVVARTPATLRRELGAPVAGDVWVMRR